ncbi:MerR family transcriptional regulator [Streptomyces sp. SID13666]|uniref:MerR family transcriptional regulator n=1 Tax=Streptomyces TaxID=1883 RepID=UPI0011063284|nr:MULTISPECIES: MerR family transcriptional regulator [Streptomyces]MCZ4094773.1 MerR family transcriptional regulator [Streptomyces sp. H39-C1]NEA58051.1 MerR family transcriptional regulator [Streptomyces sp. SID13666]NEA76533.1 MerR family transcriptional regulator [Streptomyces sp. SID13588]QNA74271.1 MerR family transcriptional regulator [Streptomyces sp. So13.3]
MFTIGDFAKHGRVSVRMLHHYDAIGLLRPARVDPASGYRFYEAGQLSRLHRVIALKDLGFSLEQVRSILDEQVSAEQLRGMLRLRRAELEEAMAATATRLTHVEARLRSIESEGRMAADDVVVKRIPAVRVAELTGTAIGFGPEHIGPVIGPLYDELCRRLEAAGVAVTGPGVAYYEDAPEGDGAITVHAGLTVTADPAAGHDFTIVDLPAIGSAATVVHHGSMDDIVSTAQTLARWIDSTGARSTGYPRELYLECPEDHDKWVTELQEPIAQS